jgi:hypothetical protein
MDNDKALTDQANYRTSFSQIVNDNDNLDSEQIKSVEYASSSLASYLVNPISNIIENTSKVVNYSIQNPIRSMIVGLFIAYQITDVIAQNCFECECYIASSISYPCKYVGNATSLLECAQVANITKNYFCNCL